MMWRLGLGERDQRTSGVTAIMPVAAPIMWQHSVPAFQRHLRELENRAHRVPEACVIFPRTESRSYPTYGQ